MNERVMRGVCFHFIFLFLGFTLFYFGFVVVVFSL